MVEPLYELFHGTADDDSLPEEVCFWRTARAVRTCSKHGVILEGSAICGSAASAPPATQCAATAVCILPNACRSGGRRRAWRCVPACCPSSAGAWPQPTASLTP